MFAFARNPRLCLAAAVALAVADIVVALLIAAPAWAQPVAVTIDNFTFNPPVIMVKPGDAVSWTNRDDIPHTVRASGGTWKCAVMDTGGSCEIHFATAGEFPYFCSLHPKMTGTVVVKE